MKDILRFIKKHSHVIVGTVIVIFLIILAIIVKNFFFPSDSGVYYGTRLEGIEKVKIKDKALKSIEEDLKDKTKSVNARIQGRIVYVDIVSNDDIEIQPAKDFAYSVLNALTDEQKAYYDIQVMVNNEAKKDEFPIVGYKHHSKQNMSWTK
jgi:hypothetical protein